MKWISDQATIEYNPSETNMFKFLHILKVSIHTSLTTKIFTSNCS